MLQKVTERYIKDHDGGYNKKRKSGRKNTGSKTGMSWIEKQSIKMR